jgi:hypothetical protein
VHVCVCVCVCVFVCVCVCACGEVWLERVCVVAVPRGFELTLKPKP